MTNPAAEAKPKNKETMYWVHSAIAMVIMVFFRFIPAPYPLTPGGMVVVGTLIGAVYGWAHQNFFWVSIFALFSIGLSEVETLANVIAPAFSHPNVIFLIFFFTFVGHLNSIGFGQVIARKIMSTKITKGRPWVLSLFLLLSGFIPASFMSIGAFSVVALTLLHSICDELEIDKSDKWPVLMGIAMMGTITMGFTLWPFTVSAITITGMWQGLGYPDAFFPFLPYMAFNIAVMAPSLLIILAIVRFVYKPDVSKLYKYSPPDEKPKFDSEQKFALKLFVILLAMLMAPQVLPRGTPIHTFFAQFGMQAVIALVLLIGVLCRKDGKPRLNLEAAASKGLGPMFPVIVMVGTIFSISGLIGREALGFTAFVAYHVAPLLDTGSATQFTIIVLLVTFVLVMCMSGMTVRGVLSPMLVPIIMALGFPVMPFLVVFSFMLMTPIWLPSANLGAVLHGFPHIGSNNVMKYMPLMMVVYPIIAIIIGIPIANLLFR